MPASQAPAAASKLSETRAHVGLKTWHRAVLVLTLTIMAIGWLAWLCTRDPRINFLPRDARAEWILFPKAIDTRSHGVASLDTVFRREFELNNQPQAARLDLRAAKRAEIKINGTPVRIAIGRNWKDVSSADVVGLLRTGKNNIEAKVFNDNAPPALWLALTADQLTLRSDGTWEASCTGSAWRGAALALAARLPGPGNPMAGGEEAFGALRTTWLIWLIFAGVAIAICIAGRSWLSRLLKPAADSGLSRRQITVLLLVISGFWMLLFLNNAGLMPYLQGFDSSQHVAYVKYIQERGALPLPTEGFEMFQPPLYYLLSAVVLSCCGLSVDAQSAILVLRLLTLLFGLLQFTLVFLSLRLVFPGRLPAQLVGLLLAAFLPMQLYLSHYVTNETLAATLITASLYLGLRLLRAKNPAVSQFAWLGLCMGAAMLTKATALLMVVLLFLALVIKVAGERPPVAIWLRNLGAVSAIFLATCGWHYLRIWRRFGTPLLGNWDAASGFSWWQDPGFHTLADYTRFGRSFVAPLFSGFCSFADGIYSTLWGDGLCGGVSILIFRPPWNYDLMVAGYFLALAPTLLIVAGAAAAFWRFVRKPSLEWFVLIGLTGAVTLGVIFMTLKVASYAQVKAFYGLALLVPLCFFAAVGWEVLTRGRRALQAALGALLLVWASNSFASFWIIHSAAQHIYACLSLESKHKLDGATAEAEKAVNSDPSSATARRFLASALSDSGRVSEALPPAQRAVELSPLDGACHFQLGMVLARQGQMEPAIGEARRALELAPESPSAHNLLLGCLSKLGRTEEAIDVARDGLTVSPFNAELHHTLGVELARKEDFVMAANHFVYALVLRPNFAQACSNFRVALRFIGKTPEGSKRVQEVASLAPDAPVILKEIAWFFATQPDATLRNGQVAVRLAEHACALTSRAAPEVAALAAAYAETDKIPQAIKTAEEARLRAQSSGDAETVNLTEKLLTAFQGGHAYREEPVRK